MAAGSAYAAMPAWYQLRVSEFLDEGWSDWFDGVSITHDAGGTTLEGHIVDQAALYGLIARARDLGLTLLAVIRREPGEDSGAPSRRSPALDEVVLDGEAGGSGA